MSASSRIRTPRKLDHRGQLCRSASSANNDIVRLYISARVSGRWFSTDSSVSLPHLVSDGGGEPSGSFRTAVGGAALRLCARDLVPGSPHGGGRYARGDVRGNRACSDVNTNPPQKKGRARQRGPFCET